MRPGDIALANEIKEKLNAFSENVPLPGINTVESRDCFIEQIIDSIRRIKYVTTIRNKEFSPLRADPGNEIFDPLKAAVWHMHEGNINEAFWLVFLSVHFGKNLRTGWNLVKNFYSGLGTSAFWNWERITSNTEEFLYWLDDNNENLKACGNFGNHRKYQSLQAFSSTGTGSTIRTYINWVGPEKDHQSKIAIIKEGLNNDDPKTLFHSLYRSLNEVMGFGRTAKFDYLTMIGKLGLVSIEPDSTYMQGATGPLSGARLLFGGSTNSNLDRRLLHELLNNLEEHLNLYFGMQVLEDSLCNWQKQPNEYVYFGG